MHACMCVKLCNSAQTIVGSELNVMGGLSSLRSFGTSLSSGVDVDNNEYNGMIIVMILLLTLVTNTDVCCVLSVFFLCC